MERQAKLLVNVVNEDGEELHLSTEMFDKTPVTFKVRKWLVERIPSKTRNRGWLPVVVHGKRENKVQITLPEPSVQHGRRIIVDDSWIKFA